MFSLMRILQNVVHKIPAKATTCSSPLSFIPFSSSLIQVRWKKPANTAQTRLQGRVRDHKLDLLTTHFIRLNRILNLHSFLQTRKRGSYVAIQLLSRWAPHVGLSAVPAGEFLQKYPHIFEVFTHPVKRNPCCKFTVKFSGLLHEENDVILKLEKEHVMKIKRILMMSPKEIVHLHALRLARRELGLPRDFRELIIHKYDNFFRLVDVETVELVNSSDHEMFEPVAEVEKWRVREYKEKWLSEFEVKHAFPVSFPTGFKKEPGFREKLRNWQRLNYVKPYEKMEAVRVRTCGGIQRYEKRAVAVIHELLCLTVEKMVEVQHLAHFRVDLGIEVNIRELILMHPGIFYLSTRGNIEIVFLQEAYSNGYLIEPNPIYDVRRKMLDLIVLGNRCIQKFRSEEIVKDRHDVPCTQDQTPSKDGGFVISILENFVNYEEDLSK